MLMIPMPAHIHYYYQVISNEGVAALMKGSITFSLKRVADWSSRFLFAVMAEDWLFKKGDAVRLRFRLCFGLLALYIYMVLCGW